MKGSLLGFVMATCALVLGCGGSGTGSTPGGPVSQIVVISPTGNTVFALSGRVRIVAPAGAVSSAIAVTVSTVPTAPQTIDFVRNSAFELEPDDTDFATPVELSLRYDPVQIPTGAQESDLVLAKLSGADWVPVAGSTVNEDDNRVQADVSELGVYGVIVAG